MSYFFRSTFSQNIKPVDILQALDKYVIRGVSHNISLLRAIMGEKRFIEGDTSTSYLKEIWPEGIPITNYYN